MLVTDLSPLAMSDLYINSGHQCLDPRFVGFRLYYSSFGHFIQPKEMIESINHSLNQGVDYSSGYTIENVLIIVAASLIAVLIWFAQLVYMAFLLPRIGRFNPTKWLLGEGVDALSRHPQYMMGMVLICGPILGVVLNFAFVSPLGIFVARHIGLDTVVLIRQIMALTDWIFYIVGGWLFF